eukprot:TRINITY_DN18310_c0_g1_i1.p1 TRINITY_DN18310_c0_g1~~TRINITY_DN18310_c0_g1_i1.p1  ORF type:complete len:265 (+),score=33.25 TRINITY_DN18310_c0_g1_i1:147-941(+)
MPLSAEVVEALRNPTTFWNARRKSSCNKTPSKASKPSKRSGEARRSSKAAPTKLATDPERASKKRKAVQEVKQPEPKSLIVRACAPPVEYHFAEADGYQEWRVREQPSLDSAQVGLLLANEKVMVDQIYDGVWLHLETRSGLTGWAHGGFGKLTPVTASIYASTPHTSAAMSPPGSALAVRATVSIGELDWLFDELKCGVCLCTLCDPVTTVCGHSFCQECIESWASKTGGCPTCKAHIGRRAQLNVSNTLKAIVEAASKMLDK